MAQTAVVDNGSWSLLPLAVANSGSRLLLPFYRSAIYFCKITKKKNKKNPKALLAKSNSAQEGSAGRRAQ
jgi:hypothetical protein